MANMEQLKKWHEEDVADAKRYPVGTKLVQTNGGPTGEIVAVKGNYGKVRVVRTADVTAKHLSGR